MAMTGGGGKRKATLSTSARPKAGFQSGAGTPSAVSASASGGSPRTRPIPPVTFAKRPAPPASSGTPTPGRSVEKLKITRTDANASGNMAKAAAAAKNMRSNAGGAKRGAARAAQVKAMNATKRGLRRGKRGKLIGIGAMKAKRAAMKKPSN